MTIREGDEGDLATLIEMYRLLWLDNGVEPEALVDDPATLVRAFVEDARRHAGLRFFVAEDDGVAVGCAACQRYRGLFPDIRRAEVHRAGYVWGVYVEPNHRRSGLGEMLTARCVEVLGDAECTHVYLHAVPMARPLYSRLGFEPTEELRLPLG